MYGHVDAARALLKAGADTEAVGTSHLTPFHYAAEYGLAEVELLVDSGANKEKAEDRGYTPLMRATDYGKVEVVKVLLAAGVDPKKKNSQGRLPGHIQGEVCLSRPLLHCYQPGPRADTLLEQAGAKA